MTNVEQLTSQEELDFIECHSCNQLIPDGEHFYRISQTHSHGNSLWFCTECIEELYLKLRNMLQPQMLKSGNKEEEKKEYNRFDYFELE